MWDSRSGSSDGITGKNMAEECWLQRGPVPKDVMEHFEVQMLGLNGL